LFSSLPDHRYHATVNIFLNILVHGWRKENLPC
jgi:hypothetical protein